MLKIKMGMRIAVLALTALWLAGCGGGGMMVKADKPFVARSDKALIVFMRSSFVGSAVSSSVFEVTTPKNELVGILDNGDKLAHYVTPGAHDFMVVGESADFLRANVLAGKTYYVMATPRMGMWKARFSMKPLRQADLDSADFKSWSADTSFAVNTPASQQWAEKNAASIQAKRAEYWPEWQSKSAVQRESQTLNPQDGR